MAGRLIGDAMWRSRKIASLPPAAKAEYSWMYQVAHYNGAFELDARDIWVRAYAYNRPEITIAQVEGFLTAFVDAKLLFTWEENGKRWGWWTGSDKPGRMPRPSWQKRYQQRGTLPPTPPKEQLERFLVAPSHTQHDSGPSDACQRHALGLDWTELNKTSSPENIAPVGAKSGTPSAQASPERVEGASVQRKATQAKLMVLASTVYSEYPRKMAKDDALKAIAKAIGKIAKEGATDQHADFGASHEAAAAWLKERVWLYSQSQQGQRLDKDKIPYPARWMNAGQYSDDPREWQDVGGGSANHKTNGRADVPDNYVPASEREARGR